MEINTEWNDVLPMIREGETQLQEWKQWLDKLLCYTASLGQRQWRYLASLTYQDRSGCSGGHKCYRGGMAWPEQRCGPVFWEVCGIEGGGSEVAWGIFLRSQEYLRVYLCYIFRSKHPADSNGIGRDTFEVLMLVSQWRLRDVLASHAVIPTSININTCLVQQYIYKDPLTLRG